MFHSLYLVRRVPTCQLEQELARFLYRKRRKMSKSSSIFPQRVPEQFFWGTGNETSYAFLPLVTATLPFMTAYVAQGRVIWFPTREAEGLRIQFAHTPPDTIAPSHG
jgi:hypothetical protein